MAKPVLAELLRFIAANEDLPRALARYKGYDRDVLGKLINAAADRIEQAARIASLEARRAELATRVEPALLTRYENIRKRRGGVAVTQVIGGTCKGCNRQIPPQIAIILVRANTIENCPNCNRIIYVPEAVSPVTPPAA